MTASIAALASCRCFLPPARLEVQRPLAIVVIGGLVSATALTLLLLPFFTGASASPRPPSPTRNPPDEP